MTENILVIHNVTTNEIIERKMTVEEIAEQKQFESTVKEVQDAIDAQAKVRESALKKLSALGLTDKEIASLIQ